MKDGPSAYVLMDGTDTEKSLAEDYVAADLRAVVDAGDEETASQLASGQVWIVDGRTADGRA